MVVLLIGRILTASFGVGRVSGHRMIDVISGDDQRPRQEAVSVPGRGVWRDRRELTPVIPSAFRSCASAGAGRGGTRQAPGRHHGPFGMLRAPIVPNEPWRVVPVPVTAPVGGAARQQSRLQRWRPAGLIPQACRARHRSVFRVGQRGYRVIAAPQPGNHIIHVTLAHTARRQPDPIAKP